MASIHTPTRHVAPTYGTRDNSAPLPNQRITTQTLPTYDVRVAIHALRDEMNDIYNFDSFV